MFFYIFFCIFCSLLYIFAHFICENGFRWLRMLFYAFYAFYAFYVSDSSMGDILGNTWIYLNTARNILYRRRKKSEYCVRTEKMDIIYLWKYRAVAPEKMYT